VRWLTFLASIRICSRRLKGDAEIHALSRCQMILTEAKKRAKAEFEQALDVSGLTRAAVRERVAVAGANSATYRVRQRGFAGMGATLFAGIDRP
jgi:hypothetical protein